MMPRLIRIFLRVGAVIVLMLLGLNLYISFKPAPKAMIDRPLAAMLPSAPPGWTAQDQDIANTPEMIEQVESVLHYDDAAYRVYSDGNAQVAVYVAHWLPGKFSPAKVGSHTPDTCWVHNGWTEVSRKRADVRELAGGKLKPLEFGKYSNPQDGENVDVIFWHLVGGEPVRYDLSDWHNGIEGRLERLPAMFADFAKFGLDQRKEQLMIRISSNVPFEQLWTQAGFAQMMDQISRQFGLYDTSAADAQKEVASAAASPSVAAE
jgi:hypothetical protein